MGPFPLARAPVPVAPVWLNFGAWLAIWIGLVVRDKGVDIHTPSDQGSRTRIGISLWSGVAGAFLLAWAIPGAQLPGSGWPLLLVGLVAMWSGIALRIWAVRTLG